MMSKRNRIVILVAALALGLLYVLPMWRISLEAPQYPEGLGMVIRIDDIVGQKPHDLSNINNLNHYIGMKRIVPDAIPELVFMPWIVAGLMVLGVLTAALGRRALLYGWVGTFLVVSVAGLVDFWKWEYDYGHDLDEETAIIKIPGMSYQPPLIGSRQILNFTAHSWPGAGGWIAILSALTGMGVVVSERRRSRVATPPPDGTEALGRPDAEPVGGETRADGKVGSGTRADDEVGAKPVGGGSRVGGEVGAKPAGGGPAAAALALLAASALALQGCGAPSPRPIAYGEEGCAHCHMTLAQEAFGAEIVTRTGKVVVFDAVECLVAYLAEDADTTSIHSIWVVDYAHPGELIRAEEASFLMSPSLRSPMGAGLAAFADPGDREEAMAALGGEAMAWNDVRAVAAVGLPAAGHTHEPGGHPATSGPAHTSAGA